MRFLTFLVFCLSPFFIGLHAQTSNYNELPLLKRINYDSLRGVKLNDVWGYTDSLGHEYALVGTTKGVSILDISSPTAPKEVFWLPGRETIWRDIKTYKHYAYITSEADDGLKIIDLSSLPEDTVLSVSTYKGLNQVGSSDKYWDSAHNLWIDTLSGTCYIFGPNRGNGGVIILDIATNPVSPIEKAFFDNWYVHDGYARNETMYLAHIYEGFFSIVDISNLNDPKILAIQETPLTLTHNIWPTDDGNYLFTTDERNGGYVTCYKSDDFTLIEEIDRIQSTPNGEVMPHNAHVMGDFLITSFYTDGVIIHNISDPTNSYEIGRHSTYKGEDVSGSSGCWGAYPFFPSQLLIASDREYGLYILQPDYDYLATSINPPSSTLEIFPNPASNLITLNGIHQEIEGVITDNNGRLLFTVLLTPQNSTIDISSLPKGIYILRMGTRQSKFIKH